MPSRKQRLLELREALRRFSGATVLMHAAVADRVGLAMTDHKCLDILMREGSMSAGRLATLSHLTTGAITGIVDRLEKAGYVARRADPSDRRRVIIELQQEKALATFAPVFESIAEQTTQLLAGYSVEQLTTILDFITHATELSERVADRLHQPRDSGAGTTSDR